MPKKSHFFTTIIEGFLDRNLRFDGLLPKSSKALTVSDGSDGMYIKLSIDKD